MMRGPLVRFVLIVLWSLAVVAAATALGSHGQDRSAYPSTHSGARP
jgi:hypothetical protein